MIERHSVGTRIGGVPIRPHPVRACASPARRHFRAEKSEGRSALVAREATPPRQQSPGTTVRTHARNNRCESLRPASVTDETANSRGSGQAHLGDLRASPRVIVAPRGIDRAPPGTLSQLRRRARLSSRKHHTSGWRQGRTKGLRWVGLGGDRRDAAPRHVQASARSAGC
jgi:hypothetical protein